MKPILETESLVIRDFKKSDFDSIQIYASDDEITQYMPWGPNSEKESQEYLNLVLSQQKEDPRDSFEFAIVLKSSNLHIGGVGIRVKSKQNKDADMGYILQKKFWGRGYATEASREILRFGFEDLGINRIWATTDPENIGSKRVLEKIGMQFEGRLRENMNIRGEFRDSLLYAALKSEFSS